MKDLAKLRAVTEGTSKGKNPSIEHSLDSLLQTLYQVRSRLEAGTTTEDTFALLAQTVEAKKKEIDEKQKEVYNAIARVGKALDKVRTCIAVSGWRYALLLNRLSRKCCLPMIHSSHRITRRHLLT